MDRVSFAKLVGFLASKTGYLFDEHDIRHLDNLCSVTQQGDAKSVTTMLIAMAQHRKIEAIKECRTLTGLGLKEAKDLIESAMHEPPRSFK